jgi:hypothetical protein
VRRASVASSARRFVSQASANVFHCHNLIHEDAGMMAQFEVVADASATTSSPIDHAMG